MNYDLWAGVLLAVLFLIIDGVVFVMWRRRQRERRQNEEQLNSVYEHRARRERGD